MTPRPIRLVMLGICLAGMSSPLFGQSDLSASIGLGGTYFLSQDMFKSQDIWRNGNMGIPVHMSLEYSHDTWWGGIYLQGGRQGWKSGPGAPIWPGRNKPMQHERNWWGGMGAAVFGQRISMGYLSQIQLSPYVGIGYDWQQPFSYCGAGATFGKNLTLPVSQADIHTLNVSSLMLGTGVNLDYQMSGGPHPIWIRLGVSGWWRELPLLSGTYRLWEDGGHMAQRPPWAISPPRPGQRLYMEECPAPTFSAAPDQEYELELPGHVVNWVVGLRFDL